MAYFLHPTEPLGSLITVGLLGSTFLTLGLLFGFAFKYKLQVLHLNPS